MNNDTNIKSFTHLRVRSSYSIGRSICSVDELVRKAREQGMPALGLCDYGIQAAWPEFIEACLSTDANRFGALAPIKPIIGIDIPIEWKDEGLYVRLIVRNLSGYQNLLRIIASTHKSKGDWRVIGRETLNTHSDGLSLMMAKIGDDSTVDEMRKIFGDNFFFELSSEEFEPVYAKWPTVKKLAVCPVSSLENFKTQEEIAQVFPHHPEWIANVNELVDSVETFEIVRRAKLESESLPIRDMSISDLKQKFGSDCVAEVVRFEKEGGCVRSAEQCTQAVVTYPRKACECFPVEDFGDGTLFSHFQADALVGMGYAIVGLK